jgi:hypothetical protein
MENLIHYECLDWMTCQLLYLSAHIHFYVCTTLRAQKYCTARVEYAPLLTDLLKVFTIQLLRRDVFLQPLFQDYLAPFLKSNRCYQFECPIMNCVRRLAPMILGEENPALSNLSRV